MNSIASALAGIQSASSRFDNAAQQISQWGATNNNVDIAVQSVELMIAQTSIKLNAAVIRSQEDVNQSVLDILA